MHLITECEWVDKSKRDRLKLIIAGADVAGIENSVLFLNCGRDMQFMNLLTAIMSESLWFLRTEIQL